MGVHPPQNGGIGYDPWQLQSFPLILHAPHHPGPPSAIRRFQAMCAEIVVLAAHVWPVANDSFHAVVSMAESI